MNRTLIFAAVATFALAGCPNTNGDGLGGRDGGGGQGGGGQGGGGQGGGGQGGSGGRGGGGGSQGGTGGSGATGGNRDAGRSADRGPDRGATPDTGVEAGGTAATCGVVTCRSSESCCNASCGICTGPGQGCVRIACPAGTGSCTTDADCRLVDDYCTGCDCRALATGQPDPICGGPGVQCIAQPCANKAPACQSGRCVARDRTAAQLQWYFTCGDPVCGAWRDKNMRRCTPAELRGTACPTRDEQCDPMNDCNSVLLCTDKDPQLRPGGCPIARAR
jgi:hypothetical protein